MKQNGVFTTLTPNFRHFLYTLLVSIKKHQLIGVYYDASHLEKEDAGEIKTQIINEFGLYYNVLTFFDFIPGFLTNPDGVGLFPRRPQFTFVIFLNFNPNDNHHRFLLDELIDSRIEYILISPYDFDLVAYVPYLYLKTNLNNIDTFQIFQFYVKNFLKLHLKPNRHNQVFFNVTRSFPNNINLDRKLAILNRFYLIGILRSKRLINIQIAKFLYFNNQKCVKRKYFSNLTYFIKIIGFKLTKITKFYKYAFKSLVFKKLYKARKKIFKTFKLYIKRVMRKPHNYIKLPKIRQYYLRLKKSKKND